MNELELVAFDIISAVGTAKSMYVEAIQNAKEGKLEEARKRIEEGDEIFVSGHHSHAKLVQKEANGEKVEFALLLMHAEDQLMSAETIKIMALEIIDLYEKFA